MEDKVVGNNNFAAVVAMEDTGGKLIRARSFHTGQAGFAAQPVTPKGPGALHGGMTDESGNAQTNTPIRDGLEPVSDPVVGSIDMGHQYLFRAMLATANDFSVDQMNQTNDNQGAVVVQAIGGEAHFINEGQSATIHTDDSIHILSQNAVLVPTLLGTPKRWD
jgi:hypothetical protein